MKRFPRNVIVLGWVSFFTDLATEMLYPVMPLFVVGTLGASPAVLGLIDGVAEGMSSGLRWIGGALSDRYRRRKPFVTAGYTLSALSKPVMGLAAVAGGWPLFFAGRCTDRLGKSIRTSARDALIADSTAPTMLGSAFGLHRGPRAVAARAGLDAPAPPARAGGDPRQLREVGVAERRVHRHRPLADGQVLEWEAVKR
jgi:MFS family permease